MAVRCHLVCGSLLVGVLLAHAEDQSIAGFKAPPAVQAPAAAPKMASSAPAAAPIRERATSSSALPPRVLLELPHGLVLGDGPDYVFRFEHAPMPEVVGALGRAFGETLAYSGPSTREVSAQWRCQGIEEALARLVDRTNLRFRLEGTAWSVEEMGKAAPEQVDFAELAGKRMIDTTDPETARGR